MIRSENRDGICVVTIDRPEKLGALDLDHRMDLAAAFEAAVADPDVAGLVLAGTGGAFCAGGDVTGMGKRTPQTARALLPRSSQRLVRVLYYSDKPVVAAVDGAAAGLGWSLALACDHVVATPRSKFIMAFARIGLVPDGAGVFLMRERIGPHATKQIVARAATLSAGEAMEKGLVDTMMDPAAAPGSEVDTAVAIAREMAGKSLFAFGLAKQLVASATGSFDDYLRTELLTVPQAMVSDEHKAAAEAFRNRGK